MFKFSNKYFVVLGAFLIELTLGYLYSAGKLQMDIINYMTNYSYSGNSVTVKNSAWIFGAVTIGTGASISLGGFLELKYGAWITVLIGSWFMSLNFGLMYFTLKSYLSIVIITFGFFGGIGVGIAYGVVLCAAAKRFSKNRGVIFGITVSGIVLSTVFSDSIHNVLLQENSERSIKNLPKFFVVMSSIYFVIQIFGALLIKCKPVETFKEIATDNMSFNSESYENRIYKSLNHPIEYKPHQIIIEYDFWNIWLLMFLISANNHFIVSLYNKYLNIVCMNSSLTGISIILLIFNCFGRIFWGYLFDKIQFKKIMIILTLTNAIFIGTLPVFIYLKSTYTKYAAVGWLSIINFLLGGHFSVFPSICAKLFGMKYFACNYGMIYTSCSVSSTIVSSVLNSIEIQDTQLLIVFVTVGILSLLAGMIALLFRGKSLIVYNS